VPGARAVDVELVGGRVDRGDRGLRAERHRDFPRHAVLERLGARQLVIDPLAVARQDMLVDQPDLLRGARRDRKHGGADQVVSHELDQRGVAQAGDDLLVVALGLGTGEQPSGGLWGRSGKREAAQHGPVRHGHEQLRLGRAGGGVAQVDVEGGRRDLLADVDVGGYAGDVHLRLAGRGRQRRGLGDEDVGRRRAGRLLGVGHDQRSGHDECCEDATVEGDSAMHGKLLVMSANYRCGTTRKCARRTELPCKRCVTSPALPAAGYVAGAQALAKKSSSHCIA
jgi:hypothetical protein